MPDDMPEQAKLNVVQIAADQGKIYALRADGQIFVYDGKSGGSGGWVPLDPVPRD